MRLEPSVEIQSALQVIRRGRFLEATLQLRNYARALIHNIKDYSLMLFFRMYFNVSETIRPQSTWRLSALRLPRCS